MNVKFRHIVVLMMTTVVICSCERDVQQDVPEPVPVPVPVEPESGTPIVFSASQQQETAVTRAATPLEDERTTFKVWGYKNYSYNENENNNGNGSYGDVQTVFLRYTVQYGQNSQTSTTSNSDGWEYILADYPDQSIKYWDWAARAYRFFGVSGDVSETYHEGVDYQFSFEADTANVKDTPFYTRLWFSTGNTTVYPTRQFGQPVQLEFLKPFAKVRFLFVSADPDVELEDLNIENPSFGPATDGQEIVLKGGFTVTYPLSGTATTETWTVDPSTGADASMAAFTVAEQWYTVLPSMGQGAFKLAVTVNNDPDKGCTVPAEYMNWLPSFQYTYIFKVFEEGGIELGEVKTAFTQWKPGKDASLIIYNW